jgi:hypothetical protein
MSSRGGATPRSGRDEGMRNSSWSNTPRNSLASTPKGNSSRVERRMDDPDAVIVGDTIILWTEDGDGVLMADGVRMGDDKCWISRSNQLHMENAFFQIYIKHVFIARTAFMEALQTALPNKDETEFDLERFDRLLEKIPADARKSLQHLAAQAAEEERINKYEDKRSLGTTLIYGQTVQLRHVKSGRYLSLAPPADCEIDESSCTRELVLTASDSEESWWRVCPAYKLQGEGDAVRYDDAIFFFSAPSHSTESDPGMEFALNYTDRPILDSSRSLLYTSAFHVSALPKPVPWKMRRYTKWSPKVHQYIKGGDVVRLQHKQLELWVACGGEDTVELIHEAPSDMPVFSLWRFEMENPASGSVAQYGCTCRLRHIVSGRYLTLDGMTVSTETSAGTRTLFYALPVFMNSGSLTWSSVVHLQHKYSGHYLHAFLGDTSNDVASVTSTPPPPQYFLPSHAGHLHASEQLNKEDGFSITRADDVLLMDVYIVSAAHVKLGAYVSVMEFGDGMSLHSTAYNHNYMISLLTTLRDMCWCPPSAGENALLLRAQRQKLLRELGILNTCMSLCKITHRLLAGQFPPEAAGGLSETDAVRRVLCVTHELLKAAITGCQENGTLLMREFDEFQAQVTWEGGVSADHSARTLAEMIQGNVDAVRQVVTAQHVEIFMLHMESDVRKRPLYAHFLACLCCCNGVGIRRIQDAVVAGLLKHRVRSALLISMRSADKGAVNMVVHADLQLELDLPSRTIDLQAACKAGIGTPERYAYDLFFATVELLYNVCGENHAEARALVQMYAPYEALLTAMSKETLPASLRCHLTKLMLHLYVERHTIDYIVPQFQTQLLNKVDAERGGASALPMPLFEADKELSNFRALKHAVLQSLSTNARGLVPEPEPEYNKLTLALANLASQLLFLGFFNSEDEICNALVPTLLSVMDGSTDSVMQHPQHRGISGGVENSPRCVLNDHTTPIMSAKLTCCKMLLFILDLRLSVRIPRLLAIYKSSMTANSGKVAAAGHEELRKLAGKMRLNSRDELAKVVNYMAFPQGGRLSAVLIDLLHYQHQELAVTALRVLFRERSPKLELYKEILNVQVLIEPAAVTAYMRSQQHLTTMRRLLPALKSAMHGLDGAATGFGSAERSDLREAIEACANLCEGASTLAAIMASANAAGQNGQNGTAKEGNGAASSNDNRETLRRAGIHTVVLDIIASAFTPHGDPDGQCILDSEGGMVERFRIEILMPCFEFIHKFCLHSRTNQESVFPHVRMLMCLMNRGLRATRAVSSVLHENEALCLKLSETAINFVVDLIAGTRCGARQPCRKPEYLYFLHNLCKVGGRVMPRNQMYVLKYLSENGPIKLEVVAGTAEGEEDNLTPESALVLFRGRAGRELRAKLVDAGEKAKSGGLLEYNIALLQLLETLLLDFNPDAFSRVQVMLPPEKICEDLTSPDCLPEAKSQLLNLMRVLYLSKELRHKRHPLLGEALWDLLEHLCNQLAQARPEIFSKYAPRSRQHYELQMLLTKHWAPLLLAVLDNGGMLGSISPTQKATGNQLVDRIVDILNECCLDPKQAYMFLMIYEAARRMELSGASILSDKAAAHALSGAPQADDDEGLVIADMSLAAKARTGGDVLLSGKNEYSGISSTHRQQQQHLHADGVDDSQSLRGSMRIFAQVFLETVDPRTGTQVQDSISESEEDDDDDEVMETRKELQDLCHEFHNSHAHMHTGSVNKSVADSTFSSNATKGGDAHHVREFKADEARHLVRVLQICAEGIEQSNGSSIDASSMNDMSESDSSAGDTFALTDRNVWSWNMILGLNVLRVLAREWRESATELLPPKWLLEGLPGLIVQLVCAREPEDRVVMCSLELGVTILHGGNDFLQDSFLKLFTEMAGAPKFFEGLKARLQRGAEEARVSKIRYEEALAKGSGDRMSDYFSNFDIMDTGSRSSGSQFDQLRSIYAVIVGDAFHPTSKRGDSHADLVLRFLQLLCEGHNLSLQNYLRFQPQSARSIDMVTSTAGYVDALTPYINPLNAHIAAAAMDTIAEFVQNPCRPNQRALADTKLCACANEILDIKADVSQGILVLIAQGGPLSILVANFGRMVNKLKASTVTALLSMLECVDDRYIPERMLASLDTVQLIDNMNQLLRVYNPALLSSLKQRNDAGEIALHIPKHLARDFWDFAPGNAARESYNANLHHSSSALLGATSSDLFDRSMQEDYADEEEDAYARREDAENVAQHYYITYITLINFDRSGKMALRLKPEYVWDLDNLKKKVGVIEISRKGVLEKAYFIIPSVCSFLTHASKQWILFGVNRSNLQMQLTSFSECFDMLYDEMKHQKKLTEHPFLNILRMSSGALEKAFFLNAILLNALMLIFYTYECDGMFICGDTEDLQYFRLQPGWEELVTALAAVQCVLAVTRQYWYVVERGLPSVTQRILKHRNDPPKNALFAWLVRLPTHQSDPTYRHISAKRNMSSKGVVNWMPLEKVTFVKVFYVLTDWYFIGISIMTLVNVLALLLTLQGAKLFLLVQLFEVRVCDF